MTNSCFSVGSLQKCYHSDLMTQMSAGQEGQALANAIKTIQTDGKLSPIPFETSPLILTFKWMLLWCKWEWLTTSCKCASNCSKCFGEYHIWGSYLHHFFQLEHKGSRSPAWKKNYLNPNLSRCSVWLNEDVKCGTGIRQFNHHTPQPHL